MKMNLSTTIIAVILFFLTLNVSAQANFSGTWKRNNDKTDPGGLSINSVAVSLEINQDQSAITIKGTNKTGTGEVSTYTDVLKLDGSPAERATSNGQKKQMTLQWSPDKKQLMQISAYKDEQGRITQTIKLAFSLSEDGKTLRILDERNFDGETFQLQDVFEKQ